MHDGKTILLSAYACDPVQGSEPGIGWNWALELTRMGHEVWVLTQPEFEPTIRRALEAAPNDRLHVEYVSMGRLDQWRRSPRPLLAPSYYVHVLGWQWAAYRRARELCRERPFDLVHHLTMGTIRIPSFMGGLGLPFVYGPVAGGLCPPRALRQGFDRKAQRYEVVRKLANALIRLDPLVQRTLRQADAILASTRETMSLIPKRHLAKARVQLAIGTPPVPPLGARRKAEEGLRLMFAGRLLCWKGLHLALKALARARTARPDLRMTIIGSGTDEAWLKGLAHGLGLDGSLDWIAWMKQEEVLQAYAAHDAFLFPSMRDSGGMVVLEAMGNGLPVVCLDLGGPGVMVDGTCGRVVETAGRNEEAVIASLAEAILNLARDPALRARLSEGARARAQALTWSAVVRSAYAAMQPLLASPARPLPVDRPAEAR